MGNPSRISDGIRTEPALTTDQNRTSKAVSTASKCAQKAFTSRRCSQVFDSSRAHHMDNSLAFASIRCHPLKRHFSLFYNDIFLFKRSPAFACCLLTSRRFVGIFVGILSMPKRDTNMPLTDTKCRNAKGQIKPRKLSDGGGLHLVVNPDGAKYWRLAVWPKN